MINKKFIAKLKSGYQRREAERRQIISLANIVLHNCKRIIFALQRGEFSRAEEGIKVVEKILNDLKKKFGQGRLNEEGAYQAAAEEYVEAKMLQRVLVGQKIEAIPEVSLTISSYLGGLCDLTGELLRFAINEAAAGHYQAVSKIKELIGDIMAELVEFDMTGYERTKYDQAKNNLRKIEQIDYEIKIRTN